MIVPPSSVSRVTATSSNFNPGPWMETTNGPSNVTSESASKLRSSEVADVKIASCEIKAADGFEDKLGEVGKGKRGHAAGVVDEDHLKVDQKVEAGRVAVVTPDQIEVEDHETGERGAGGAVDLVVVEVVRGHWSGRCGQRRSGE